ncbi:MAG: hypothetical protein NVSMB65_06730 [Chloroflexota bacterium]
MAYAAACSVVRAPGLQHNPLSITGPHGLGKTHLLKGIAGALMRNSPTPERILYVTAEGFSRRVALHIRTGRMMAFRQHHREATAFLMDDVSLLLAHNEAMAELAYTVEQVLERGGQIVVADTQAPASLTRLPESLRRRLAGGLLVSLREPTQATLVQIARQRCRQARLPVDDSTIRSLVDAVLAHAAPGTGTVRALDGAVKRIGEAIDHTPHLSQAEMVRAALATMEQTKPGTGSGPSVERVLHAVCQYFGISQQALLSKRRDPWTVQARQLAMYLLHEDSGLGVTRVGRELGRDHSTVLHGHAQIARALANGDREIQEGLLDIRRNVFTGRG